MAEITLRDLAFALAHRDGNARRRAVTNQRAEGHGNHHRREGEGKTRKPIGPNATAHVEAVDDIVERRDQHSHDGGKGVLPQQRGDGITPKLFNDALPSHTE